MTTDKDSKAKKPTRKEVQARRSVADDIEKSKSPVREKRRKTLREAKALKTFHEPGYYHRYVNDVGDRIAQFLEAGYEFVEDTSLDDSGNIAHKEGQHGNRIRKVVNHGREASARYAYLMRLPQEYYDEDKRLQQEQLTRDTDYIMNPANVSQADYGINKDIK